MKAAIEKTKKQGRGIDSALIMISEKFPDMTLRDLYLLLYAKKQKVSKMKSLRILKANG